MDIEIRNHIFAVANELKNLYGEDYGEQYNTVAMNLINSNTKNISDYQILIDAAYSLIDSDYKDKLILNIQKKIKELETIIKTQTIKINNLEEDNKSLKSENTTIKIEMQQLNKKVDLLMRNQYLITIAEAIKNVQRYIIQTATKYDSEKMDKIKLNLDEFIESPENQIYKIEIETLMAKFEINKYNDVISKVINKRNRISHPDPVEMEMLELACNTMKTTYPGIDALYNHYQTVYDYFN